jgi:2'-5' RNA ligase
MFRLVHGPFAAQVTGSGEFLVGDRGFRVPHLLVNSGALSKMQRRLMSKLSDACLPVDELYGFIPHITLASPKLGQVRLAARFPVPIERLDLVTSKRGIETGRWSFAL